MRTRSLFLAVTLLASGVLICISRMQTEPHTSSTETKQQETDGTRHASHELLCAAGIPNPLDISIEPRNLPSAARDGSLLVRATIANRGANSARANWTAVLVDDVGTLILETAAPSAADVGRAASLIAELRTPNRLQDGFYELRFRAAMTSATDDTASEARLYFRLQSGTIRLLNEDQWQAESRTNQGRDA